MINFIKEYPAATRRRCLLAIIAAAVVIAAAPAAEAGAVQYRDFHRGTGTYGTTWDTYINEAAPTTNYYADSTMYSSGSDEKIMLIWFPYIIDGCASLAIPPGAKIDNAFLILRTFSEGSTDNHFVVQMINEWVQNKATWEKAHTYENWSQPGLKGGVDFVFRNQVPVVPINTDTYYAFNATDIVQAWADGQPNYGFAVGGADNDLASWQTEGSTTEAYRPKLEVYFYMPQGNVTQFTAGTTLGSACNCTFIDGNNPDTNYGTSTTMDVTSSDVAYWEKALIRWPNFVGASGGQVTPGATVYHAQQRLYLVGVSVETVSIYPMLIPWIETQATWNMSNSTHFWATAGIQAGTEYAPNSSSPGFVAEYTPVYCYHRITRDVSGWVNGTLSNYGWVIQIENGQPFSDTAIFNTNDAAAPEYRPNLAVFWGMPTGGTAPTAPTGLENPYNSHEMPFYDVRYSSIYNDDGPGGVQAVRYRAQMSSSPAFTTHFWDSGVPLVGPLDPGDCSGWLNYSGPAPSSETSYYFRMRYYTNLHDEGAWSPVTDFRIVESMHVCNRKGYHMLKLNADTQGRTVDELFGDNVPALIIYEYDEVGRSWNVPVTLDAKKGYFIWSPTDMTVSFGANGDLLDNSSVIIGLSFTNIFGNTSDGWNLVRNAYWAEGTHLNSDTHIDGTGYDPVLYWPWDGNQYGWYNISTHESGSGGSDMITPGQSFWVRANVPGATMNLYHPQGSGAPTAPKPLPPPVTTWRMLFSATTGTYEDTSTYISVREGASEQYDYADVFEATPPTLEYIMAYFDHDDWGPYSGQYTQDTRPFPAEGESVTWTATVEATNASGTIVLGWEIPVEAAAWDFTMRDETDEVTIDLKENVSYSYAAVDADTRDFTITVTRCGEIVLGDADGDGELTVADAELAARAEHGLVTLTDGERARADLDGSGKVDVLDALLMLRCLYGHLP